MFVHIYKENLLTHKFLVLKIIPREIKGVLEFMRIDNLGTRWFCNQDIIMQYNP